MAELNTSMSPEFPPPETFVRGLANWQLRRVTKYMSDHLGEDLRLRDIAAIINLSVSYFCTAFRLSTGKTPVQWVIEARMAHARELLADPRPSITDIALSVGYATPAAFTSRFRQHTGTTPSQFRKLHAVDIYEAESNHRASVCVAGKWETLA